MSTRSSSNGRATNGQAASNGRAPARQNGASQTATLSIEGMTCASCVGHVEEALREAPGVEEASVNLATERATVRFRPGETSPVALGRVVEESGYGVRVAPLTVVGEEFFYGIFAEQRPRLAQTLGLAGQTSI